MTDRLKHYFDTRGIAWQIPGLVVAFVTIVLTVVAGRLWLRDPLADFFTSDLEVWHLFVAAGAEAGVAVVIAVWWVRRARSTGSAWPAARYYPKEIAHFDVRWPIAGIPGLGLELRVGEPMCPKDRSQLGLTVENDRLVPLGNRWKDIVAERMRFGCFKDGTRYDLTGYGHTMQEAVDIVEGLAWGEFRSALRSAGR